MHQITSTAHHRTRHVHNDQYGKTNSSRAYLRPAQPSTKHSLASAASVVMSPPLMAPASNRARPVASAAVTEPGVSSRFPPQICVERASERERARVLQRDSWRERAVLDIAWEIGASEAGEMRRQSQEVPAIHCVQLTTRMSRATASLESSAQHAAHSAERSCYRSCSSTYCE